MTCDSRAVELLPFYWNGSLEPAEREEVDAHLADCATCRTALAEIRDAARIFAAHLPTEVVLDLAWDLVPAGEERDLYERHLAECSPCTAELEMARASRALEGADGIALFRAPVNVRSAAAPTAVAPRPRAWRAAALAAGLGGLIAATGWMSTARENDRLLTQMAETAIQRDALDTSRPAPAPQPTPDASVPSAGSAGSEASEASESGGTAAGGGPTALPDRPLESPRAPEAPLAQVFASRLLPQASTDTLRGGEEVGAICHTALSSQCPIEIASSDFVVAPSYAFEIVKAGPTGKGKPLFAQSNVAPPSAGSFLIQLDATRLAAGDYEVVVYALLDGARQEQARYPFSVEK